MARRKSLNKRSMTPAQWRMPFWEDPVYPFPNPPTTTTPHPTPVEPKKPTSRLSFGQLKARYRTPTSMFPED